MEDCLNVLKTVNEDLDQMWSNLEKNTQFKASRVVAAARGGSIDTAVEFQSVQEPPTDPITANESQ